MVGTGLYGEEWRGRLAAGIGISRGTLWSIMSGSNRHRRDIDAAMVALIERERDATAEHGMELTRLKNALLSAIKGGGDAAA